jgi:hypothetical protein
MTRLTLLVPLGGTGTASRVGWAGCRDPACAAAEGQFSTLRGAGPGSQAPGRKRALSGWKRAKQSSYCSGFVYFTRSPVHPFTRPLALAARLTYMVRFPKLTRLFKIRCMMIFKSALQSGVYGRPKAFEPI